MKYYKIFWEESRGDEYDNWGTSWWYFEVDDKQEIHKQLTIFENKNSLLYSDEYLEDTYGGLSAVKFDEFDDGLEIVEINEDAFEKALQKSNLINNKSK